MEREFGKFYAPWLMDGVGSKKVLVGSNGDTVLLAECANLRLEEVAVTST
jgi:hypothetical protein